MTNKILTLALGCVLALSGHAQLLEVGEVRTLVANDNTGTVAVGISPAGNYVLLSTWEKRGLVKLDLESGKRQELTTANGAGHGAVISNDGSKVLFYDNTFGADRLRRVAVKSVDVATGREEQLLAPSRDVRGLALVGAEAEVMANGKLNTMSVGGVAPSASAPVSVSIKNRLMELVADGKAQVLAPNGEDKSYLWPSLSPDGSKLLYYVSCDGAYVCDLDGENAVRLGELRAPQWYDNAIVLGMKDQDNGYVVTKSSIVAKTLDGTEQQLTGDDVLAMYPLASSKAGKIVYSTPTGEVQIVDVKKVTKQ